MPCTMHSTHLLMDLIAADRYVSVDYTANDIWDNGISRALPRHTTINSFRKLVSRKHLLTARHPAALMQHRLHRACPSIQMADSRIR